MKKFVIVVLGITSITLIFLAYISNSTKSYNIDKICSYNDFIAYSDGLKIKVDTTDSQSMQSMQEHYLKQLNPIFPDEEVSIFVVEAEEKFEQNGAYCLQEVTIDEVLNGNHDLCNTKIILSRDGGVVVDFRLANEVYIDTISSVNVMKPGNHYLVFCEKSPISDMLNVPLYGIKNSKFSVLNLDNNTITAISEYSTQNNEIFAEYSKYADCEYFNTSQDSCDTFLKIKNKILKQYYVQ